MRGSISSHGQRVVRVPADNMRPDLRLVFPQEWDTHLKAARDSLSVIVVSFSVCT